MAVPDDDIYIDISFLLCLTNFYGFSCLKVEEINKRTKHLAYKKLHYIFSIVLQILVGVCAYFVIRDFNNYYHETSNGELLFMLRTVTQFYSHVCFVVSCISNKFHTKNTQKLYQQVYEVERDLRMSGILIHHKSLKTITRNCVIFYIANAIVSTVAVLFENNEFHPLLRLASAIYIHYNSIVYSVTNCQLIVSISIFNQMFRKLEEAVKDQFLFDNYQKYPKRIGLSTIVKYHHHICEIVREANRILSIPLLVVFMGGFFMLTVTIFGAAIAISNDVYVAQDLISFLWLGVTLSNVLVCVVLSHNCMNTVSKV